MGCRRLIGCNPPITSPAAQTSPRANLRNPSDAPRRCAASVRWTDQKEKALHGDGSGVSKGIQWFAPRAAIVRQLRVSELHQQRKFTRKDVPRP